MISVAIFSVSFSFAADKSFDFGQKNANNGEIVVALLRNGMATLKRYFKEATRIRLEPANAKMSPIFAKEVVIQGRVVGLIRKYQSFK